MKRRQSRRLVGMRKSKINPCPPGSAIDRLEQRTLFAALATFTFGVSHFVEDNQTQTIYATVPANNSVAVINAQTLALEKQIQIGADPLGIAISQDDSTVYVADGGADQIGVIDTSTNTAQTPLPLAAGGEPTAVEVGTNNRLWVLANGIEQVDATTGASTGAGVSGAIIYSGDIVMNAAGTALYYTQYGLSPSSLYKFDVSGASPVMDWQTSPGSNGRGIALSYDGQTLANPCGAPYYLPLYNTNTTAVVGTLATGGSGFAFSPDDKVGYEINGTTVEIYNLNNYLLINGINTGLQATQLFVEETGQYLFVAEGGNTTQVYDTGRLIPIPPVVTTQPVSQEVSGGSSVTFTSDASGTPSPTVQWQESSDGGNTWTNVYNATSDTLTIPKASADAGYEFRAVFTNAGGTVDSNPATLTVVTNGHLTFTQQPTGTVSGENLTPSILVDVEDASNNVLTEDNSVVTLSISSGPSGATLVGGGQTSAVNGVATFQDLSLPLAGTYTLKATDGVLTGYSASFTSTGVPKLSFAQQPTADIAGSAISPPIVVDISNANGTPDTTDDSLVTLSILSGPSGADLGGTVTVNAVNGVATFNDVIPTEPGTYTLEATDSAYLPATSNSFQVSPGAGGPTSITLATSTNSLANGNAITLTATVSASGPTPGGTVQFFDDGVSLGMETLSNGQATLTTADLPAGVQYLTAAYFGTAGYAGSTSPAVTVTVQSQASLAASVSGNDPAIFVPGSPASVDVTIVNQGDSTARGRVGIQVYATTDGVATDGVAIAAHPTATSVSLRSGKSKTVRLAFTVPSTITPGSYTLMAVLTPISGLTAANISQTPQVASPFATSSFSLSFGMVGTRHGVKLVRVEPDGTVVTYALSGPGTGTLSGNGITSPDVTLTGTTAASHLTITTRGGSGGLTLAGLSDDSSIGSINAPSTTLDGALAVQGNVGQLILGSLTGANLAASNFNSVLIAGPVASSNLLAGTNFGANGVPGGGDDSYAAGVINSVRILGNVTGSIIAAGLNPVDGTYLNGNDVLIAGGRIGKVSISGSLSSDSRVLASSLPKTALVSGTSVDPSVDTRFSL